MKVSICIPQYNRCEALKLVIQDILEQTYQDFELLIVDDASSDNTLEVMSEFSDPRIRFFRNETNLGLYPNFNRCLELATGEYVAIYHNHDRYSREIVELSVRLLDQYPQAGFVHTGTKIRYPQMHKDHLHIRNWATITPGKLFLPLLIRRWDSPIHQPTVMARRKLFDEVGFFDEKLFDACADTAIWMKMCMKSDVGYIPLPLMQITPRTPSDFYGEFRWSAVLGMARAHRLGVDLLYGDTMSDLRKRELAKLQIRHDFHFLLLLSQWISKNRVDYVEAGLDSIRKECSRNANKIARAMSKTMDVLNPFWILAAGIYRFFLKYRMKFESEMGGRIKRQFEQRKEHGK